MILVAAATMRLVFGEMHVVFRGAALSSMADLSLQKLPPSLGGDCPTAIDCDVALMSGLTLLFARVVDLRSAERTLSRFRGNEAGGLDNAGRGTTQAAQKGTNHATMANDVCRTG
ncbi:hypothetical protein G8O24_38365 [Bradyrhizobium sp. INPA01-394B]|nr:hypothetical protein [Bradyrhizobium campsiandrae]